MKRNYVNYVGITFLASDQWLSQLAPAKNLLSVHISTHKNNTK